MQQSDRPIKPILPIAQNDASKATIPTTSADDTRASQSLGFPPRTGLPPEAGGVPPQLADMNGLMYLLSGIDRWIAAGGRFPFDNAFATDPLINGYPLGAVLPGADALGDFISTAEGNQANPNTVGTGWVPGYHYGATALTGVTGGTVTLTPAQAAKRVLRVAGTLTSNLVLVVPGWQYDWTVYNNTSGAFTVSVRTATGSAAAVPQNNAPTPVVCDGTNCTLLAPNIGAATSGTQAARLDQVGGRLLNVQTFTVSGTYTPTAGTRFVIVEGVGGGGAGGGARAAPAGQSVGGGGGGSGAYFRTVVSSGFSGVAVTVGAGGVGVGEATGGDGATTSFGTFAFAPGGKGGIGGSPTAAFPNLNGYGAGAPVATGGTLVNATGSAGGFALVTSSTNGLSGTGGTSAVGGGGNAVVNESNDGAAAFTPGAGGSGALTLSGGPSRVGGNGGPGRVVIYEYA